MALILGIESATTVCSVSLSRDGSLLYAKESNEPKIHASAITVFIQECLEAAGLVLKQLDAIAVSSGPGSYTGLRIGVSTAKGLCYALGIPLISIGTLQAMAWGAAQAEIASIPREALLCPMIDARRMEVYAGFYRTDNSVFRTVQADIVDEQIYKPILESNLVYFFGDGMPKCKAVLEQFSNARFIELLPSSRYLSALAEARFRDQQFEDVAYFEPFYLKDFMAGPKKA